MTRELRSAHQAAIEFRRRAKLQFGSKREWLDFVMARYRELAEICAELRELEAV